MNNREQKIALLRKILAPVPDDISDDELLSKMKGTFLDAQVDLKIAANNVSKAFANAFKNDPHLAALRKLFTNNNT